MRKSVKAGICTMAAVMLLAGCTSKSGSESTASPASPASSSEGTQEASTEAYVAKSSVKLGEYKGIKLTVEKASVTPEEVEAKIQQDLNSNYEYVEADREARDGDMVNIDFKGLLNGEAFEGGTSEKYDLVLGSGSFIEGFEEGLIGAKKGDKKSLDLTFPENYGNEELKGKAVVFEVTVNSVEEKVIPELTEEFILKVFPNDKNVETYRKRVEDTLLEQKKAQIESLRNNDIMNAVMTGSEVISSTDEIEKEYQTQYEALEGEATLYGMDMAGVASMYGTDEEGLKIQIRLMATDYTKQKLLFRAIAEKENLSVTDEDMKAFAVQIGFNSTEEMYKSYTEAEMKDSALFQKVLDFLVENAEITETDGTPAPEAGSPAESTAAAE